MTERLDQLIVERTIDAPVEAVWAAWTTEAGLASWWWSGWDDTTYDVDPVVGGRYEIAVPSIGIGVSGEYLMLTPPHRLEMTWVWDDDDGPGPLERVTVDLVGDGGRTTVRVHHTGPWTTPDAATNYQQGWNDVLDALASHQPFA